MPALGYLGPEGEAMTTGAGLALLGPGVVASSVADSVLERNGRARSWPVYAANLAAAAAALLVATERDLSGRQGVAVFLGIQLVVVPATAVAWSASSPREKAGDQPTILRLGRGDAPPCGDAKNGSNPFGPARRRRASDDGPAPGVFGSGLGYGLA